MPNFSIGIWAILTIIVIYDSRENRIPNKSVLLLSIYALCLASVESNTLLEVGRYVLGGFLLFASGLVFYSLRVMAAGDVKLLGAVGMVLGYGNLSTPMFWVLMSGAGLGILYWCLARLYRPYSVTDLAISSLGPDSKTLGSLAPPGFSEFANTKMPFAPAIAVGLAIYSYLY
ncbi:prepilin peptidase [Vibrio breoganii]